MKIIYGWILVLGLIAGCAVAPSTEQSVVVGCGERPAGVEGPLFANGGFYSCNR